MKSAHDMTYDEQIEAIQQLGWDVCDLMNALRKYDGRSGFTTSAEDAIEALQKDCLDRHRDTLQQYLNGYLDGLDLATVKTSN